MEANVPEARALTPMLRVPNAAPRMQHTGAALVTECSLQAIYFMCSKMNQAGPGSMMVSE